MKKLTVACFGHRKLPRPVMSELYDEAEKLLHQHEYVEFLVGYEGEFDSCAATVVGKLMENHENCSLTLVLPCMKEKYEKYQAYFRKRFTRVEICEASAAAHDESAYQVCSREMADRADLILCAIMHESGSAWTAVNYAKKNGKAIRNVFRTNYPDSKKPCP